MSELRRRLDQRVDARLDGLRQSTERMQAEAAFVERVMFAVNGRESDFVWLGAQTTRRSLLVCGTLVALSLGWAVQSQGMATSAVVATALPMETPW